MSVLLSDDHEHSPKTLGRTRELVYRIIACVIVILGMALIVWDATPK